MPRSISVTSPCREGPADADGAVPAEGFDQLALDHANMVRGRAAARIVAVVADRGANEGKGLKSGALGFVSNVVIGVASTAPGYSLASSLGLVVAAVGLQSPAIMLLAFVPMLMIAASYYYMNRANADAGTTFTWVTMAMGPWLGWIGGWAIVVADIIVMANLSQIAGIYTFLLVGADSYAASTFWVTFVGVLWIVIMTAICYIGVELSAKTQWYLLAAEIITLAAFAVVALWKVYVDSPPALGGSLAVLAEPLRDTEYERACRGHPGRRLHLLGVGQHRHGQRGVQRSEPRTGAGGDRRHAGAGRHLRDRLGRGAGVCRAGVPRRQLGRRALARSATRCSARRWTSC